jgi:putative ABC transport system permease protein
MKATDLIRFATDALSQHRRRSALSLLGVSIGIIAVVSLTALGEGARRFVEDQFSSLGNAMITVVPGKNETTGGFPGMLGAPNPLTLDDARALEREVPGVVRAVPLTVGSVNISHRERSRQTMVIGTTDGFRYVRDLEIRSGRFLPPGDPRRGSPIVVIGRKVAEELFPGTNPLGQAVRVGDWRMRVIGILASRGTQVGFNMDDTILIPVSTGLRLANRDSLARVMLQMQLQTDMESAKRRIIAIMKDRHDEEDITCLTQDAVMGALSSILNVLTAALLGIAGISLTVAGVGIMNVMLVSVSERTDEVGLMKALGASQRQILAVFLVESVILSSAGGLTGLAIGWLLVEILVTLYPAVPASPPLWAVWAVLGVSLITGILFGVLPAWRASKLDPVVALSS